MAAQARLIGNDLKFKMTSDGAFSPSEHEWDAEFYIGTKVCKMTKRNVDGGYQLTCNQENMGVKPMSDGSWVFLLDTTFFGSGRLMVKFTAYIPDADFDPTDDFPTLDSIRNRVERYSLITVLS